MRGEGKREMYLLLLSRVLDNCPSLVTGGQERSEALLQEGKEDERRLNELFG